LDVAGIQELNAVVDGYGVGTNISSASVIDFSLDIVEIEGLAIAKRGKLSGRKKLWRCPHCYRDKVTPHETQALACECGSAAEALTSPLITEGKVAVPLPRPQEIRSFVLQQLPHFVL